MIVKNIITLDTKKGLIPELSFVEGISDNIILIKVFNIGTNPKIEIYYGCDFKELTGMDGNEFIIPSEYCSDNEIIHLRYIDDKSKSNFIHIVGDESAYENLKLTKKSNFLFCCDGKRKKSSNSTSDITIDDYLDILSKNPVTNEAISSAIVEIQNVINEEKENLANLSSDVESLQATVQENKTGTDKAISGLNASMGTMGQYLSTLGTDVDTLKSSTTEGMSNLSNRVGVVESKVGEFGTAAKKNYTTTVASGNTNLPTSGAVYTALDGKAEYEEGTFTPKFWNNSNVQQIPTKIETALYKKIENLCYIYVHAYFIGNGWSVRYIDGLPFAPKDSVHTKSRPSMQTENMLVNGKTTFVNVPAAHGQISLSTASSDAGIVIEGFYNV